MAHVNIPAQDRDISDPQEIAEFLKPHGINYENWDVAGRVNEDSTNEEILEAYAPEIERLKKAHGFVTADIINVNPDTPGLDEMLGKFDKEHLHTEDEVRFTVEGSGVFHINPQTSDVFSITVEAGDLISVPKGTHHWFNLCTQKRIRCIRLFEDMSGWTPEYMEQPVHENYAPLCMGPDYVQGDGGEFESVVKV